MKRETIRNVLVVAWLMVVPSAHAGVLHSSDLGWTAGQDVSTQFAAMLSSEAIKGGDELILDHTYRISGTHRLPGDFTLSAVQGAGFDVTDASPDQNRTFLILDTRTTLRNLTITYLNTPPPSPKAGTGPKRGIHFYPMIGITAAGKSDIRIEYCLLDGSINHQIKLSDCARPQIIGCHIRGGYWSTYLTGNVTDAVFRNCLIERCQGDGIKTGRGGSYGVKRPLVENCVFQDCGRDAIDTTGGWKDGIVRNCVMRRLFSGMDIKSYFRKPEHLSADCSNTGILVERCTFTDMANCITFSTLDRGLIEDGKYFLDAESAQQYAPHDVDINDCIFERTGPSGVRMLLIKGGHSIRYRNAQFWGERIETVKYSNVYETFGPNSLSKEVSDALNHSVVGNLGTKGVARAPGDTSVSFRCSPQKDDWGSHIPSYSKLSNGPLRVRLLPGHNEFTFTVCGCPAPLDHVQALVDVMRREGIGNGFDPGPGVVPAHRPQYEYLRQVGWPVVGYAQTADHQVKEGQCRLSAEQDTILRLLADAGIFAATQLGEWGYYFHNLSHEESWWRSVYGKDFDQWKHLMKPKGLSGYDRMPARRRECYDTLEDYFRTRQQRMRGWNLSITGHSHYEAYVGQWGARLVGLELGENIAFTQSKIAFARGAARRNGLPWSIQVSPWFAGSQTTSGPLVLRKDGTARGLDAGHSLSLFVRMWLHAWFAGTAMVTPEASISIFFEEETPPYRLTSYGRKASEIFKFVQSRDRGVPYTPVAIVLDQFCGYNAYMARPWGILEPTEGDVQIRDLFQEQLFPGSDHIHRKPFPDNPEASYLRPTPYGEIFDVQLSDAPADVLASYPVLLLAGDHAFADPFIKSLEEALMRGARLLMGQNHARKLGQDRLTSMRACGEVEVLKPWVNPKTKRPAAISHERLRKLCERWLPAGIDGDPILYQFNQTSQGWVVELTNNSGVVKFPTKAAVTDPTVVARVGLDPRGALRRVVNWHTREVMEATDKGHAIEIGPGETVFVELLRED